jgi:hypothetical protein
MRPALSRVAPPRLEEERAERPPVDRLAVALVLEDLGREVPSHAAAAAVVWCVVVGA